MLTAFWGSALPTARRSRSGPNGNSEIQLEARTDTSGPAPGRNTPRRRAERHAATEYHWGPRMQYWAYALLGLRHAQGQVRFCGQVSLTARRLAAKTPPVRDAVQWAVRRLSSQACSAHRTDKRLVAAIGHPAHAKSQVSSGALLGAALRVPSAIFDTKITRTPTCLSRVIGSFCSHNSNRFAGPICNRAVRLTI